MKLFRSWADRMPVAEDPLEFMYENMWAEDVEHRAIEGAPDDHGPIIGRDAMRAYAAAGSSGAVHFRDAFVCQVVDGKFARFTRYPDIDEARARSRA